MAVENFSQPRTATPGRAVASRRSHAIYGELQREIVLGVLAPRSSLLELELAARFQVSQGTIREALLLLQEEGLVLRQPHRGTNVVDCRAEDAEELIHLRHDIECRGLRRAMSRRGKAMAEPLRRHMDNMMAAATAGDEYLLSIHDRAFHTDLFEFADLPPIQPMLARCLIQVHRYKILHHEQQRNLEETAGRHQAIIDGLESGDAEQAVLALSHHITTIADFGPSIITKPDGAE
ncbi:GntR family transcriptional regulator [Algicella marina]|uniref:FCD domain-containing protein n=1 Tax=Algicella marina TaxID=2683284 RepID=A0A6P1SX21_9RHOB|nr:GntR family transcriptional regulator [Algicella marina]QHQ34307.1 FCD domain-containing protein [Algicella marina]